MPEPPAPNAEGPKKYRLQYWMPLISGRKSNAIECKEIGRGGDWVTAPLLGTNVDDKPSRCQSQHVLLEARLCVVERCCGY